MSTSPIAPPLGRQKCRHGYPICITPQSVTQRDGAQKGVVGGCWVRLGLSLWTKEVLEEQVQVITGARLCESERAADGHGGSALVKSPPDRSRCRLNSPRVRNRHLYSTTSSPPKLCITER